MSYLRNIKLSLKFQGKSMSWWEKVNKVNAVAGIIGTVVAIAGLVLAVSAGWKPTKFTNDRFSCQLRTYAKENAQFYTVMYHNDKGTQPWLKMVNTFGDDWTTPKRCEAIADRLESFRKDGLLELTYRDNPKTPNQSVICAMTKSLSEKSVTL